MSISKSLSIDNFPGSLFERPDSAEKRFRRTRPFLVHPTNQRDGLTVERSRINGRKALIQVFDVAHFTESGLNEFCRYLGRSIRSVVEGKNNIQQRKSDHVNSRVQYTTFSVLGEG